jgi:peptide-methionine (S)-S-oxide reductase
MRLAHAVKVPLTRTVALILLVGLHVSAAGDQPVQRSGNSTGEAADTEQVGVATFAGGCFWCLEPPFDKLQGVISTTSGYIGGHVKQPTYKQVSSGRTGHAEALQVKFDPQLVSYEQLLTLFWHNVDPTQANGQFCDIGNQYRSAIFFHSPEQKDLAIKSQAKIAKQLGRPIHTRVVAATAFYPAEEYHQDYYTKNPTKYKFYRWKCGRDAQLDKVWGAKAGKP